MLKPAHLYEQEWREADAKWWNTRAAEYATGRGFDTDVEVQKNNMYGFQFVSVDENDDVTGYICCEWDWVLRSANHFGMMSYRVHNPTFIKDMMEFLVMLIFQYDCQRIEWWAYADNPANKMYKKFIDEYGGAIVGKLTRSGSYRNGEVHDTYIYEILRENFDTEKFSEFYTKFFRLEENPYAKKGTNDSN